MRVLKNTNFFFTQSATQKFNESRKGKYILKGNKEKENTNLLEIT